MKKKSEASEQFLLKAKHFSIYAVLWDVQN